MGWIHFLYGGVTVGLFTGGVFFSSLEFGWKVRFFLLDFRELDFRELTKNVTKKRFLLVTKTMVAKRVGLFYVRVGLEKSPPLTKKSPTPTAKSPTAIPKSCWTWEYSNELEFSSPFMEQWTLDARGVLRIILVVHSSWLVDGGYCWWFLMIFGDF